MTRNVRSTTWILIALVALFTACGLRFAQREDRAREEEPAPTPIVGENEKEATVLTEPDADSTGGGGYGPTGRLSLTADPSDVYTVSEAAVELLLCTTEGTVIGRRPARFVPGSVSVVTW